jgi:hypothetical protein
MSSRTSLIAAVAGCLLWLGLAALADEALDPMMSILAIPFVVGLAVAARALVPSTVILGLRLLVYLPSRNGTYAAPSRCGAKGL